MPTTTIKFFKSDHLPKNLQTISQPMCLVADLMEEILPDCAEKSAGMRKLLEAKDCFVRAELSEKSKLVNNNEFTCPHGNNWDDCPDCRH